MKACAVNVSTHSTRKGGLVGPLKPIFRKPIYVIGMKRLEIPMTGFVHVICKFDEISEISTVMNAFMFGQKPHHEVRRGRILRTTGSSEIRSQPFGSNFSGILWQNKHIDILRAHQKVRVRVNAILVAVL